MNDACLFVEEIHSPLLHAQDLPAAAVHGAAHGAGACHLPGRHVATGAHLGRGAWDHNLIYWHDLAHQGSWRAGRSTDAVLKVFLGLLRTACVATCSATSHLTTSCLA